MCFLRLRLFAVIAVMAAVSACASLGDLISAPRVKLTALNPVRITPASIDFIAKLAVTNDNPISLPVDRIDFAVSINDRSLLTGSLNSAAALPALSVQTVDMPFRLKYQEVVSAAIAVAGRPTMNVQMEGKLFVGKRWGFPGLPFRQAVSLQVPQMPRISFSGLRFLGPERRLGLVLNITNVNGFPLTIRGLNGRLEINGGSYSLMALEEARTVKPGQDAEIVLKLGESSEKMAGLAAASVSGRGLDIYFLGELDSQTPYGPFNVPVDSRGSARR